MATIVTAYYRFTSKHTHDKYEKWMDNFLKFVATPIVVFSDENSSKYVFERRGNLPMRLIIKPISEWYVYKYLELWKKHLLMDHEHYHNINLYMIWNEKTNFVKEAIDKNYFNTEYFLWCDVGCFRFDQQKRMIPYSYWPHVNRFKKDKLTVLSVVPFNRDEKIILGNGLTPSFKYVNRIGGTMFGGHKDVVMKWHKLYYDHLELYFQHNYFAGKDQSVMATVVVKYPELFDVVQSPPGFVEDKQWFYLQPYLLTPPLRIAIVGPGMMPIPPIGWGACESLIWDYTIELVKMNNVVTIINEKNPSTILQKISEFDPNVVHIQYDDYGYLLKELSHIPKTILTTHYAYIEQSERWGGWKRIFNYGLNIPDNAKIHALSDGIKDVYIRHGLSADKINVLRNGARSELFQFTPEPKYPERSICVAKIDYRKRQWVIQNVKNLYFAGRIEDKRFTNTTNHLGEWTKETLYSELTNYGNLVLLSDGEADPLVTKEALMAGLGLVVSEWATANLDLTKPYIDVIPKEKMDDIDYISNVIEKNKENAFKYREEIRKYAVETFGWNVIVKDYLKLLRPKV